MTTTSRFATLFCFAACLGTIAPVPLTAQTPAANAKAERVIPELPVRGVELTAQVIVALQGKAVETDPERSPEHRQRVFLDDPRLRR